MAKKKERERVREGEREREKEREKERVFDTLHWFAIAAVEGIIYNPSHTHTHTHTHTHARARASTHAEREREMFVTQERLFEEAEYAHGTERPLAFLVFLAHLGIHLSKWCFRSSGRLYGLYSWMCLARKCCCIEIASSLISARFGKSSLRILKSKGHRIPLGVQRGRRNACRLGI